MYEIGRLCVKIAGRDAGMKCLIIDVIDKNHVMIDGQTRRRKCNVRHLEPLGEVLKVTPNAPKTEIVRIFKTLSIDIKETKPKKVQARPKKVRKKKPKPVKKESKPAKKAVKEAKNAEAKEKPAVKPIKPKTESKTKAKEIKTKA